MPAISSRFEKESCKENSISSFIIQTHYFIVNIFPHPKIRPVFVALYAFYYIVSVVCCHSLLLKTKTKCYLWLFMKFLFLNIHISFPVSRIGAIQNVIVEHLVLKCVSVNVWDSFLFCPLIFFNLTMFIIWLHSMEHVAQYDIPRFLDNSFEHSIVHTCNIINSTSTLDISHPINGFVFA